MAKSRKFQVKVYAANPNAKSGRSKVGATATITAADAAAATDEGLRLLREGVGDNIGAVVAISVQEYKPREPKATDANPFAVQSDDAE